MNETELYLPVKRLLEAQGYQVKAEVGGCDVLAVRGDEPPLVVELKRGFTLALLLQGIDRQAVSDAVYIAIAEPKRALRNDLVKLCRRLGLGLITIRQQAVEVVADPAPYRPRKDVARKGRLLREFARRTGDPNLGGSTRQPLMTAYRQDALRLVRHLSAGPAKVAQAAKAAGVDRAGAILRDDVYGWFEREARGIYRLTPKGAAALKTFAGALEAL